MNRDDRPTFCPHCGSGLVSRDVDGRDRAYCESCDIVIWRYENPKSAAGVIVVDDDAVLLVQRREPPYVGTWSIPAGFLERDEQAVDAARRELHEETALTATVDGSNLVGVPSLEHPDGTFVAVVVYAISYDSVEGTPESGSDAGDIGFWKPSHFDRSPTDELESDRYRPLLDIAVNRY